ncbi:uncharacterized protein LOC135106914 [Scylla paramamosain]|uniref:uncharacterized protein LOC135106914 n=1 Tax=Scylla paramamosain TaxID=85552 RepID=UPI0030836FBA
MIDGRYLRLWRKKENTHPQPYTIVFQSLMKDEEILLNVELHTVDTQGLCWHRDERSHVELEVDRSKYQGSAISVDGNEDKEVTRRMQARWRSWRDVSGVLCDRKMAVKLKGKIKKTVLRPAMTCGAQALPVKKVNEKRMEVTEMRMLLWMCGVAREDRFNNTRIRGTVKVGEISKKTQEARLRWYGHVMRRDGASDERRGVDVEVQGRRRRGRPKIRWKDCIRDDMREKGPDTAMAGEGKGVINDDDDDDDDGSIVWTGETSSSLCDVQYCQGSCIFSFVTNTTLRNYGCLAFR